MRLTPHQITVLKEVGLEVFGPQARLHLFGSRTDDTQKGGDIDLYVTGVHDTVAGMLEGKIRFLVRAKQQLGERRIDLVFAPADGKTQEPIQRIASETGIAL